MGIGVVQAGQLSSDRRDHLHEAIIVDARPHDQFLQGHIPGAIWIGWETWCGRAPTHAGPELAQCGYWGVMSRASAQWYGRRLTSEGLCADRPIVVYADGPRSRGREGRVAWMLLYLGATDVRLLDGGWGGWQSRGGAVEAETQSQPHGRFTARFQPQRRATLGALRASHRAGRLPTLVDTRSRPEFDGEIQEYLPRRGHLPGASLVPFASLFDPSGRYVAAERYLDLLPREARQASKIVAYCEVGVRASLFAMLHEAYTGQVAAVYDGSLMQWALEPDLPIAAAPAE